jgi:hypothetical protein
LGEQDHSYGWRTSCGGPRLVRTFLKTGGRESFIGYRRVGSEDARSTIGLPIAEWEPQHHVCEHSLKQRIKIRLLPDGTDREYIWSAIVQKIRTSDYLVELHYSNIVPDSRSFVLILHFRFRWKD